MKRIVYILYSNYIHILEIISLMLFFIVAGISCTSKNDSIPQASDSLIVPCQEVGKSTLLCFDGPHLIWKLESDYSWKTLDDTSSMLVVPVRFNFYDTLGKKTTLVLSDSGTTTKELEKFFLWGNVYIKNWDGLIINSESLWWNKIARKVGSDDFVEIRTPSGDVLRGKGLDASESFSWWTLRKNVSGEFPNFKERLESDEVF